MGPGWGGIGGQVRAKSVNPTLDTESKPLLFRLFRVGSRITFTEVFHFMITPTGVETSFDKPVCH
jgi:hypothetical protein